MDARKAFQKELTAATLRAAHRASTEFADEGLYSFALYHSGEYRDGFATISTDAGLSKAAEPYRTIAPFDRVWIDLPTTMQQLKWHPGCSPHHRALFDEFRAASKLLDTLWAAIDADEELNDEEFDDEDMDDDYNRLCTFVHDVFIEALRRVRAAGIFGERVTLNILTGDQGDDERLETAALFNSTSAVHRLSNDFASRISISASDATEFTA